MEKGTIKCRLLSAVLSMVLAVSPCIGATASAETSPTEDAMAEMSMDTFYSNMQASDVSEIKTGGLKLTELEYTKDELTELNGTLKSDYARVGEVYDSGLSYISTDAMSYDYTSDFFYKQLDSYEKALYRGMYNAASKFMDSSVNLTGSASNLTMAEVSFNGDQVSEAEALGVYVYFYYANPQFYYLNGSFGNYPQYDTFLLGVSKNYATKAARNKIDSKINSVTNSWMAEINKCSSALEKEALIASKICDNVTYKFTSDDQTLIGSLYYGKCVCNGYAMTFVYFCRLAGLKTVNTIISFDHSWNAIMLDGTWYLTDVTWMDNDDGGAYDLTWFNNSQSNFNRYDPEGHHKAESEYFTDVGVNIPSCTKKGPTFNNYSSAKVKITGTTPSDGAVRVNWNRVIGATKYAILYRASNASSWINAKTISSATTTCKVSGLKNGQKYAFLVRAYVTGKWSSYTSNEITYATAGKVVPVNPTISSAVGGNGQAAITWGAVNGAAKYVVLYRPTGTSSYTATPSTTKTSFTVTGLKNNQRYAFVARAYINGAWTSFGSKHIEYATPTASPAITNVTAASKSVSLSWNSFAGASQYAVLYRPTGTSSFTTAGTTKNRSFTVSGLKDNQRYAFVVRAYVNGKWSGFGSVNTKYATPSTGPVIETLTAGNGTASLSWVNYKGATNYAILYRATNASSYTNAGTTTGSSFTIKGLKNGQKYAIAVRAYVNGKWTTMALPKYVTPTSGKGDFFEENILTDGFTDGDFIFDGADDNNFGFSFDYPDVNSGEVPVLYA